MTIRPIEERDIEQVIELGRAMHRESQYADLAFSAVKVGIAVMDVIQSDLQIGLVAEEKGRLDGMGAAFVVDYEYGYDTIAYDRLLYVAPEHRGTTAAVRLIKRLEWWATDIGASMFCLGQTTGVGQSRVGELYRRLGYDFVGGNYRKGL